jgi:hypothetical protein
MRTGNSLILFRIIFYFCSVYFFLMGIGLVFFPHLLVKGVAGVQVNHTIIGMLRGSGGAIIPYSLIYIFTAQDPFSRKWGLYVIATANVIAIILDISSVLLDEYKPAYAMIDLPVELVSLAGILLIWFRIRNGHREEIND